MKRTIDELYKLICYKRECAIKELRREKENKMLRENLFGEIDAYTDIIVLMETSQILKGEEKEVIRL